MNKTMLMSVLVLTLGLPGLVSTAAASAVEEAQSSETKLVVDINHADVSRLTELPGVGVKVAERIVAYREENGPFEKVEELMNVRGIGEKTFLKLKPFLSLGKDSAPGKK